MLSIIIPTLNAEATLARTLQSLRASNAPINEVLVIDGGSTDGTAHIATQHDAKLMVCAPGRGRQLARGAAEAQGPWMLFLHADSVLPKGWEGIVNRFSAPERHHQLAAYFRLDFDTQSGGAKRVARLANWRAQVLNLPYGDQGLLIHRSLYDEVGGYKAEQAIMEDVDLVRRIGPMRLRRLNATLQTSAQRYQTGGWWARPLRNLTCLGLYLLGAPQSVLLRLYR
jgi:rSAM/selenodomain-associated transferase 2